MEEFTIGGKKWALLREKGNLLLEYDKDIGAYLFVSYLKDGETKE